MALCCEAVIFDLDGVLVDSNPIAERHWKRWASKHNLDYGRIQAIHLGRPTVETMREVAPHLDAEREAEAWECAESADTDGLAAFDGVKRLILGLPADRWAIATSGQHATATTRLNHIGIPIPTVLVTADDIEQGKPAPDPYFLAADQLGIAPEDCVVFEDAPAGIESAKAAGATVIAIASSAEPASLSRADKVLSCLADVQIDQRDTGKLRVRWDSCS